MIALLIHVLCSCVAFACRVLGRYRHVGEKRPCAPCAGSGRGGIDFAGLPMSCAECDGNPEGRYVDRYGLLGAGLTDGGLDGFVSRWLGVNVWLQRIWRADGDRHMHDHPWNASGSLILSGGYGEVRETFGECGRSGRTLTAGDVNLLPWGVYHRITSVKPRTWTLFVTGRPHGRGWGFLVDGRHVPSFDYLIAAALQIPIGWACGTALRDVRKGELVTDEDVKFLSDQLATVVDGLAREGDRLDRECVRGPIAHVLHAAEKAERSAPHVRNFGCAIPEPIPDTLRNDGQPDTEREPSTRPREGAQASMGTRGAQGPEFRDQSVAVAAVSRVKDASKYEWLGGCPVCKLYHLRHIEFANGCGLQDEHGNARPRRDVFGKDGAS
jgi:hypothetical protein